jgi:hypothetical protein
VAAFSAPDLTACQNWCWKPFEMTGMYGFAPVPGELSPADDADGAAADDADDGAFEAPPLLHAASTIASDPATARILDVPRMFTPP